MTNAELTARLGTMDAEIGTVRAELAKAKEDVRRQKRKANEQEHQASRANQRLVDLHLLSASFIRLYEPTRGEAQAKLWAQANQGLPISPMASQILTHRLDMPCALERAPTPELDPAVALRFIIQMNERSCIELGNMCNRSPMYPEV